MFEISAFSLNFRNLKEGLTVKVQHFFGFLFQVEVDSVNIIWKSKVTYISCEWSLAMGLALKQLLSMVMHPTCNNPKLPSTNVAKKKKKDFPYMGK